MSTASLLVVGLNHRSSPLGLLERASIREDDLPKALHALTAYDDVVEGAVLSTCNRTEVYAIASRFHAGAQDLRNFLSEFCHVPIEELTDRLYTFHGEAALRHLFRVASGLDSLIVGETEVLGQVRRAAQIGRAEGAIGRRLGHAFDRAVHVGRRVRNETPIGRNPVSISSAAVELAKRAVAPGGEHPLTGLKVAIVGAGKMGKLAAEALASAGATDVVVVNRTEERAETLARAFGASIRPLDDLEQVLSEVDIVLCSTTSPEPVVTSATVRSALARRTQGNPLLIVDIAVPRDVEGAVGELPGVVLRDIDDLKSVSHVTQEARAGDIATADELISEEVTRFAWKGAEGTQGPTIAALLDRAESVRLEEVQAFARRLRGLDEEQRAAVEHLTKRIVAKLMHTPIAGMKEAASAAEAETRSALLRELFELEDDKP